MAENLTSVSNLNSNSNPNFAIGLAVWGYKNWLGDLFPEKTRPQDFLKCYSERFSVVEGNTTFYSIPTPEIISRWKLETPSGFKFFPKLPKSVTHNGRLMPYLPQAFQFLELMKGLDDSLNGNHCQRLGGIFLQLPPSYSPASFKDLELFLASWRSATQTPLFLEVRHLQWFHYRQVDRLNRLLTKHQVDRVILDTRPIYNADDNPQQYSVNTKPNVPVQPIVTAGTAFVRYISHPICDRNTEYLTEWVKHVSTWLTQGKTVYFFVHCPLEDNSPQNARYFQELLERSGVQVPPLPWNLMPNPNLEQLGLF